MEQFTLKPNWQPIETAPEDRPIWLYAHRVDFNTGKPLYQITEVYWGIMLAYPDFGKQWIPIGEESNACYPEDEPFVEEIWQKGQLHEGRLYRGFQTTHWADIIRHSVLTNRPEGYYEWENGKPRFTVKEH